MGNNDMIFVNLLNNSINRLRYLQSLEPLPQDKMGWLKGVEDSLELFMCHRENFRQALIKEREVSRYSVHDTFFSMRYEALRWCLLEYYEIFGSRK